MVLSCVSMDKKRYTALSHATPCSATPRHAAPPQGYIMYTAAAFDQHHHDPSTTTTDDGDDGDKNTTTMATQRQRWRRKV